MDEAAELIIEEITEMAWEIRSTVIEKAKTDPKATGDKEIWEAAMADVEKGHAIGPFREEEVAEVVGAEDWICAYRFGVKQNNKVRGCDDYCRNKGNSTSPKPEKLQVTGVGELIGKMKLMQKFADGTNHDFFGWILDEADAYRQIPVRPGHRRFAVIVVRKPGGGVGFFVMIGHSFGLISAVYNYNRRSAIVDDILRKLFEVAANSTSTTSSG